MMESGYLAWLARETESEWNNDSAVFSQLEQAVRQGAIGITTNPPLSYEALVSDSDYYFEKLKALNHELPDDEFALQAMSLVVGRYSAYFMELHKKRGTYYGCVRAQVAPTPSLCADADGMLAAGKRLRALGENVMVKIPGTKAGMKTLEELAALGIPTNPTVITTVSQAVAAAAAYERGRNRAEADGVIPAWSTCAVVMGRTQDYLTRLNDERDAGLSKSDLDWAALAIVKRCYAIYREKGYRSRIMPAAYRSPLQVEQLAGGPFHSTIHPKIQAAVEAEEANGGMKRRFFADAPADAAAVQRVAAALPEFCQAYEPDGLTLEEFDRYGAVTMTLNAFNAEGWQKMITLKHKK
jgi:transaldolase